MQYVRGDMFSCHLSNGPKSSCNALENVLRPAVIVSPQAEAPPDFKSAPF